MIPILLQFGANIGLREGLKHKTPLELSKSERVRELIIVYSSTPYKNKKEDLRYLEDAIQGQRAQTYPEPVPAQLPQRQAREGREPVSRDPFSLQGEEEEGFVPFNLKEYQDRLKFLLRRVQEYGAQSNQHIKKPYLFTGSWMETVAGLEDLMGKLEQCNPTEAVMRVFNILFPYTKRLFRARGDELLISNFYGDRWDIPPDILRFRNQVDRATRPVSHPNN